MKVSLFLLAVVVLAKAGSIDNSISFLEQIDFDESEEDSRRIRPEQNQLFRDEDELPEDADDKGDEVVEGDTDWILVTSFVADTAGSGQVWAVPRDQDDQDESFVLIGGLQSPTGLCFDKNHDFLYVCDPSQRRVYQFEIDRDGAQKFVLARDQVATIYEGVAPVDCSLDAYGNLYIVDLGTQSVEFVDYLNLWSGIVNTNVTLYAGLPTLAAPMGIEVADSDTIFFVNGVNPQDSGVLDSAPAYTLGSNSDPVTMRLRTNLVATGVGLSDDYVYIAGADASIWAFDYHGDPNLYLKSAGFFQNPRGICTGDGTVFVADFSLGEVYTFDDDDDENVQPERFVGVEGAYGIACVND